MTKNTPSSADGQQEAVTAHTPGRWGVDFDTGEIIAKHPDNPAGVVSLGLLHGIAGYWGDEEDYGALEFLAECHANARLISAAPDLLAACEALLHYEDLMDGADGHVENEDAYWEAVSQARAAIAKAEGQEPTP